MAADPLHLFSPATREWFLSALGKPTKAQSRGWPPIARGESTLLLAPTGSGKTLAAFLAAIDRLMNSPVPDEKARCRVVYVSPLKALAVDIEKNLRTPVAGIAEIAGRMGQKVSLPTALIRTGDTPQKERARMRKAPPDILITTPESLYLVLTSAASQLLASIDTVIVDEIHSLVPTKRGAHLFLSLERLETLRPSHAPPLQRIGLSATQRPLDEVARLLGGFEVSRSSKKSGTPRPVHIVDTSEPKALEISVEVPAIDLARLGEIDEVVAGSAASSRTRRSIWPHLHERIVPLIRAHRSTMVFVNSRRLAERLAAALNEVAGEEIALAHHGSVAREKRSAIEERLKQGDLPAIVATSSLELGIDMGAVDLVLQIEAPPSVASGLQRIGRAGHSVGETSRGIVFPKHRGDLLAAAAVVADMREGKVEETRYPRNPLDVLAQQVVAITSMGLIHTKDLLALVRRAAPFADLPRASFEGVLDMLSGRYPSDDFAELRPRITWDRTAGTLTARAGAQRLAVTNAGTIPDRGLYGVFLAGTADERTAKRVGELDEEMVFELREGEVFFLGASSWRAETITHDRVLVTPAWGQPGKTPFWHGDRLGRPLELGRSIGRFSRELAHMDVAEAEQRLQADQGLDESAAKNLVAYLALEVAAVGDVPSDRLIILERFKDELGDWRVCLLTPFGSRVHAPWATAILARMKQERGPVGELEAVWSDDGIAFRVPASDEPPPLAWFLVPSGEIERRVTEAVGQTALFAAHFRECAGRALLLPRRRPGQRTPLWAQRKRATDLLAVAAEHPTFPILLESYRECLRDVFDLPGLVGVLSQIEQRRVRVLTKDTRSPSPFAASLLFSFVASFIYDGDAPLAERRAQALTIDHVQLRALLGETELRSLLDPDAILEHELVLQHLTDTRRARHADGVHDLLRVLGDLSRTELLVRVESPPDLDAWLVDLVRARRVFEATIAGETRFIAAEDAGKLRDALGVVPPRGWPRAFLEEVREPMVDLVSRYARTHTPFVASSVAARLGASVSSVETALRALIERGRVEEGELLPSGATPEMCDVEVLRALRRKSLARLRRAVEPVEDAAYARFLLDWQLAGRVGPPGLLEAVRQLEGCPLPASVLETDVLPLRVMGFRPWDLDHLCATGEIVWAGIEPLGSHDGRIALYTSDHEALLTRAIEPAEGPLALQIRGLLERRGAVFFPEIARALGGFQTEVVDALWSMVWAGEVTNDTLEPLRSLVRASTPTRRTRESRRPSSGAWGGRPPGTEGRWSLRASRWPMNPSETERRAALARTLLQRYGVVTREAVQAELVASGFAAVYEVYKSMEHAGRIRRGYFVAGRGATQFALPGADDRLRSLRDPTDPPETRLLAATDPANPYGAAVPWPTNEGVLGEDPAADTRRPQRAAGALVVLHDGALAAWLSRSGQALLTFESCRDEAAALAVASALASLVETGRRRALLVTTIDGEPAMKSSLLATFQAVGFTSGTRGLLRRRSDASFTSHASAAAR